MYYSVKRQTLTGPSVQFDCPRCGTPAVFGNSYELLDTICLLHVIPLWTTRNTYVSCGRCRADLTSQLMLDELTQHARADLTGFLFHDVSFVYKFLALAALLLCWAPIIGLVLALIALGGTFRVPGWPRTLAWISAVLSLVITVVLIVGVVLNEL